MKKIMLVAAAVAVVAGAGALSLTRAPQARAADPAPTSAAAGQCVDTHSIFSKMIVSKNQVLVEDAFHKAALLTLSPPCTQMDELDRIGFLIEGDSRICQIHDVKILYSHAIDDHMAPLKCLITDMKFLTRDEVKAYTTASSASSH